MSTAQTAKPTVLTAVRRLYYDKIAAAIVREKRNRQVRIRYR